jgi:hypothetical protein
MPIRIVLASLLVLVLGWALVFGPVMHESDQASLLSGGWLMAHGEQNWLAAPFYNFDKQFLTYWLLAGLIWLLPGVDLVLLGNGLSLLVFAAGLLCLLVRRGFPRGVTLAVAWSAVLLAPAFWQHAPFLASNFLAGGLVFLAVAVWRPGLLWFQLASVVLLVMATAARVDTLAILPLVLWTLLPPRPLLRWIRHPMLWLTGGLGLATFLLGRFLTEGSIKDGYGWFLHPKVYAAFLVFGLGAAFLVFGWILLRLVMIGWQRFSAGRPIGWFYLAGLLALLPAFGYYSLQMFSTRHWTVILVALFVFLVSRRAARVFSLPAGITSTPRGRRLAGGGVLLLLLATWGPVLTGLDLPSPRHPSLVLASGTGFPTADGRITMGGYLARAWEMRQSGFAHDHNHPLWLEAASAVYRADDSGQVRFLRTQMYAYYELAALLQGLRPVPYHRGESPDFYVDWRSIRRIIPAMEGGWVYDKVHLLEQFETVAVPGAGDGPYRMVWIREGTPAPEAREALWLTRIFQGNEFDPLPAGDWNDRRRWRGHSVVFLAPEPFALSLPAGEVPSEPAPEGGHFLVLQGRDTLHLPAFSINPGHTMRSIRAYVSTLPDYMSVERF